MEPVELPPSFDVEFARGLQECNPAVGSRMSETVIQSKSLEFYNQLKDQMSESEFASLTAQKFGDLAAVGMIMAELDEAGIDTSDLRSQEDAKRAVRSRDFRRHLRRKKKIAQKRFKEISRTLSKDAPIIERLKQEKSDNERLICQHDVNIKSIDKEIEEQKNEIRELEREIEYARTERPKQLAEDLRIARENLANLDPNATG